ncbi:Bromodomain-containing protein [Podospora aff. communis PSN243]|uniref:Bromodomain-containing protein n=1 Tax=Podospora aff. communis PSN243 TaxID=3040156 RepID=A0AAV9GM52_9PEZI|nr:Bromodomain-containing protein [Podospora aff. communis PSN243]
MSDEEPLAVDTIINGTDETPAEPQAEAIIEENKPFSWLQPHPIFVILLVGPEQMPFGIQKDFLCAKSTFYKKFFSENPTDEIENIVKLPDTPVEVFAFAQNYLYTGRVFPSEDELPSYEMLVGVWKLGNDLGIEGLCDNTLEAMSECRRLTDRIPAAPLLVQVWNDTPEGSSIRKLLLSWAAEYMRFSESRAEFARSLPQEVLSELVLAVSDLNTAPLVQIQPPAAAVSLKRGVHVLEPDEGDEGPSQPTKKQRYSDVLPSVAPPAPPKPAGVKKPAARQALPTSKPKRRSNAFAGDREFTTSQKLEFCADLLTRMLSGPGFWTRLVGAFKQPVNPVADGVPDYLDKVKKPMDLGTMKAKMDRKEYRDESEFLADMNQMFTNCYTYWNKKDPMWAACEKLQRTFEDKYAQMNKWISKMEGDEGQ